MTNNSNTRVTITFNANGNVVENNQFLNLSSEQRQQARDFANDIVGTQSTMIDVLVNENAFVTTPLLVIDLTFSYLNYRDEQRVTNPNHAQTLSDEIGAAFNSVSNVISSGYFARQAATAGAAIFTSTPTIAAVGAAVLVGLASGKAYDKYLKDDVNTIVDHYFGGQEPSSSITITLNSQSQTSLNYTPTPGTTISNLQAQQKAIELFSNLNRGIALNQNLIPQKISINPSETSPSNQSSPYNFQIFDQSLVQKNFTSLGINTTNFDITKNSFSNFTFIDTSIKFDSSKFTNAGYNSSGSLNSFNFQISNPIQSEQFGNYTWIMIGVTNS
jgi:hypothetical protein